MLEVDHLFDGHDEEDRHNNGNTWRKSSACSVSLHRSFCVGARTRGGCSTTTVSSWPFRSHAFPLSCLSDRGTRNRSMESEAPHLAKVSGRSCHVSEWRGKAQFIDLLRSMLTWLPEERKTAKALLEHSWLIDV